MNKKGFTLIEMMIVIAIIGILSAIAIPNFGRMREKASINATASTLKSLLKALEAYGSYEAEFTYPEDVEELITVTASYVEAHEISVTLSELGFEGTRTGRYTIVGKVRAIKTDTWAVYTDTMKSPLFVYTRPDVDSWHFFL